MSWQKLKLSVGKGYYKELNAYKKTYHIFTSRNWTKVYKRDNFVKMVGGRSNYKRIKKCTNNTIRFNRNYKHSGGK